MLYHFFTHLRDAFRERRADRQPMLANSVPTEMIFDYTICHLSRLARSKDQTVIRHALKSSHSTQIVQPMTRLVAVVVVAALLCVSFTSTQAFLRQSIATDWFLRPDTVWSRNVRCPIGRSTLFRQPSSRDGWRFENGDPMTVEEALQKRKSCKRFQRYDGTDRETGEPSKSDPEIVRLALEALDASRRTPSAFNTQPYKVVLVHSPETKAALSKCSLGPNKGRVLDSDCTAVFLADRKVMLSFRTYRKFIGPIQRNVLLRNLFYISIFSSGYPLPRILAAPLSFLLRSLFGIVHFFTRGFYPMPSLSSAETWASKQSLMYAMSFLLCCTSRGLATIPMEGLNASSIRRVLEIPSRYAIPLMISVGRPYYEEEENDSSPRYDTNDVIYSDTFLGQAGV